jgi:hypothetical protein
MRKYIAYRKQMVIYLRRHGLLGYAEGIEKPVPSPEKKKPSTGIVKRALNDLKADQTNVVFKETYVELIKLTRQHKRYEKYVYGRDSTMAVLGSSLNNDGTVEFIKNEDDNDIMLLSNMDSYILESSEIVFQNLRNDVENMNYKKRILLLTTRI